MVDAINVVRKARGRSCPMGNDRLQRFGKIWPQDFIYVIELIGRGSWIRTNDLQYPKLPRYQAALYPDAASITRLNGRQQRL